MTIFVLLMFIGPVMSMVLVMLIALRMFVILLTIVILVMCGWYAWLPQG